MLEFSFPILLRRISSLVPIRFVDMHLFVLVYFTPLLKMFKTSDLFVAMMNTYD